MIKVHTAIKERLKQNVSIVDMYKYPTIYALARSLSSEKRQVSDNVQLKSRAVKQREMQQKRKIMMNKRKN